MGGDWERKKEGAEYKREICHKTEGTDDLSQYVSRVGKTWFLIPLALSLRQFPQVAGEWLLSQEFTGIKQFVLPDKSTTRIPCSEDPCLPITALSAMLGNGLSTFGLFFD